MVVVRPSAVRPMNPVTTGTSRGEIRHSRSKCSRTARLVLSKMTPARVKRSSVVTTRRASTYRDGRNRFRYPDTITADRRSPTLATASSTSTGHDPVRATRASVSCSSCR